MSIEVLRRVLADDLDRSYLTIGPSPDIPGNVWLRTDATISEMFLGKISLDMPHEFMRDLGQVLIDCATDASYDEQVSRTRR